MFTPLKNELLPIRLKFNENVKKNFHFRVSNSIKNSYLDNIRPKNQESNKICRCAISLNGIKNVRFFSMSIKNDFLFWQITLMVVCRHS